MSAVERTGRKRVRVYGDSALLTRNQLRHVLPLSAAGIDGMVRRGELPPPDEMRTYLKVTRPLWRAGRIRAWWYGRERARAITQGSEPLRWQADALASLDDNTIACAEDLPSGLREIDGRDPGKREVVVRYILVDDE